MQNELGQLSLQVLEVGEVLEGELHHIARVVHFFVLVEDVESLQVLAFFVADNCLTDLVLVLDSAESHGLAMSAVTLHQNFGLAGVIFALCVGVAKLGAKVMAVGSLFVAEFAAGGLLVSLLAGASVAL